MTPLLVALAACLAYANGANDNSKGVATLVGYGATRPFPALLYATVTTALGAAISFWFSGGMLKSFSSGLFSSTPTAHAFFVAVLIGAFGWVILATFTGLPVSTTHAITGALIGAGLVAFGQGAIKWNALGKSFALPLAISPFLSLAIVYALAWPIGKLLRRRTIETVTVTQTQGALVTAGGPVEYESTTTVETQTAVATAPSPAANALHWFSGGLVGFARGWNDCPKIAALCLLALPGHTGYAFVVVTVAMAIGGLISGRKVLDTLSKKLTPLPLAESLTASYTTAALVCLASWKSLPVSTTHVSTGAIIGAGLANDPAKVKWKKVGEVVTSWVVTLPAAALIAATAKYLIH